MTLDLQPTVNVVCGLPGSGKSTFCEQRLHNNRPHVYVNRDSIRFLHGYTAPGEPFADEQGVTAIEHALVRSAINGERDIWWDNVHGQTKLYMVEKYRKEFEQNNYVIKRHIIVSDVQTSFERRQKTIRPVSVAVIQSFADRFPLLTNWSVAINHGIAHVL